MKHYFGLLLAVIAGGMMMAAEPVMARWGGGGGDVLVEVRGFDVTGMLRLAPTDGAEGEALLPISDVGDLRFLFSDVYREAQLRLATGRPAEALFLLEQEIPAFIPYAVLAQSNVPTAVRLYLRLLEHNRVWPEAVAVGAALTQSDRPHPLTGDVLDLIESLIRAARVDDAAWLLSRIPLDGESGSYAEIERVAHELRRAGHWREAQTVYARLAAVNASEAPSRWAGLVAYCAWHLGDPVPATEMVEATVARPAAEWTGLLGLLRGRVALADEATAQALDSLGEALIAAPANSEWRLEISVVLAEAYRAHGNPALAQRMQDDLRRLYPDSLWTKSAPKS